MKLVSSQEMRDIDYKAINEWKIPELILMENAGIAIVQWLKRKFVDLNKMTVTIIVGNGNNGGDGLVIARHLYNMGATVKVFLLVERSFTESAQTNLDMIEKLPIKIYKIDNENSMHLFKATLNYTDLLIDAILGTGINREVSEVVAQVLSIVNKRHCLKVAVDLPSGLHADTGEIWGSCLQADYTVALALPKRGQLQNAGLAMCGELTVVDIGIPQDVVEGVRLTCDILAEDYLATQLSHRARESHKGSYGHLLTVGGSRGMSGSITLTAGGALRAGVGVLTCAVPETIYLPVAVNLPEAMVHPVADGGSGHLGQIGLEALKGLMVDKDALVVGPGLGNDSEMVSLLADVIRAVDCPLVLDADGLQLLAGHLDLLTWTEKPVILTPHPGEMAKLAGLTVAQVQHDRLTVARDFATTHQAWVVLKGVNTVIATPEGTLFMNTMDSPALAVAGSGDVLAGIIGSFLAQGFEPSQACCCGVNLHGRAGQLIAVEQGDICSKAGDIIEAIPKIIRGVLDDESQTSMCRSLIKSN